jgi:L-alanine-DL-glutamate epimerase-like enolase superfamily enzyme
MIDSKSKLPYHEHLIWSANGGVFSMKLTVFSEEYPINGNFTISRGSKTAIHPVVCQIEKDGIIGQGECIPYRYFSETIEGVVESIKSVNSQLIPNFTRDTLQNLLPPGAARNAIDCALWDLESKYPNSSQIKSHFPNPPEKIVTAYTISVASPEKMHKQALENSTRSLLKLKLAGNGDDERIQAVREAAPNATLIVDANEAWSEFHLECNIKAAKAYNVAMIEQPLPAERDGALGEIERIVPIFADESLHTRKELKALKPLYDGINIKLDKTGGLTEAILLKKEAQDQGFKIMIGCMLGTSLSMAPAWYLANDVEFVDLDGPLLLKQDRDHGIEYDDNHIYAPPKALWG